MNMFAIAIEKSRSRMMKLAFQNGYTAKETVKASQHLDKLLNLVQHSNVWGSCKDEEQSNYTHILIV